MSVRLAVIGAGLLIPTASAPERLRAALHGRAPVLVSPPPPAPAGRWFIPSPAELPPRGRCLALALHVANQALADLSIEARRRTALVVSTIAADSGDLEASYAEIRAGKAPPPELTASFTAGDLAIRVGSALGLGGPRLVVTNACASGNVALGVAELLVRRGCAELVLVVGCDTVKSSMLWGADSAGFLGTGLRPFDSARDGTVLGEGAAAVLLGADPSPRGFGWLEGYCCRADQGAAAITVPEDGDGLRRAMLGALAEAGRTGPEVGLVSAHAPGTPRIDAAECRAVAAAIPTERAMNATKAYSGHLSGASAVVEALATLDQLRGGYAHGHPDLVAPDPALALTPLGRDARPLQAHVGLSNACGGGGINTSVVLTSPGAPWSPRPSRAPHRVAVTAVQFAPVIGSSVPDAWLHSTGAWETLNRAARLCLATGLAAARQACVNGGGEDVFVVGGTSLGGATEASDVLLGRLAGGRRRLRPSDSLDHGIHLGPSLLLRALNLTGPSECFAGMASSGLQALFRGWDAVASGRSPRAVVVCYDAFDGFARQLLDTRTDAEGAVAIVLERAGTAARRLLFLDAVEVTGSAQPGRPGAGLPTCAAMPVIDLFGRSAGPWSWDTPGELRMACTVTS